MRIFYHLEKFLPPAQPLVLTIGNFDGVHRGHAFVLQQVFTQAQAVEGSSCVLTFSNHPSEILKPDHPTSLLCTSQHKLELLKEIGVDSLVFMPFTAHLAQETAKAFIQKLCNHIPFSHLILGYDATLGKDRQGDRSVMQQLAKELNFQIQYLEEYKDQGDPISSSRIRQRLQQGDLQAVESLLGRPYSIYSKVLSGSGQGKLLGFPTANLSTQGLCLPPYGVYAVQIKKKGLLFSGIANLGIAPTLKNNSYPILEVHLLCHIQDMYDEEIEVIFLQFIRPEKKFVSVDDLKTQIQLDVDYVKRLVFYED